MAIRPLGPGRDGWVTSDAFYRAVLEASPTRSGADGSSAPTCWSAIPAPRGDARRLSALDFHVHADMFMNPSAEYADVSCRSVPPGSAKACGSVSKSTRQRKNWCSCARPRCAPVGESRSGHVDRLRAGQASRAWQLLSGTATWMQGLCHMLAPSGVGLDALAGSPGRGAREAGAGVSANMRRAVLRRRAAGWRSIRRRFWTTARRRFRNSCRRPATTLFPGADQRQVAPVLSQPVPQYPEPEAPAPHPMVEMHPDTAAARDVPNGDWVEIETRAGRMRAVVKLSGSLDPRVVVAQQGWWQGCPELGLPGYDTGPDGGSNYNALIGTTTPTRSAAPCRSGRSPARLARGAVSVTLFAGFPFSRE